MKLGKGEAKKKPPVAKIELEIERELVQHLEAMESFTKISKGELVSTALKRFISAHKDYFPDDYATQVEK